jgi:hypothetical protein
MGEVIFSCPTTGRSFNSGLHATPKEMTPIHAGKNLRLHCRICNKVHEFDSAAVGICKSPNFCRTRKDCQSCPFAIHCV